MTKLKKTTNFNRLLFMLIFLSAIISSLVTYRLYYIGIEIEDPNILFSKPPFPIDDESLYLATIAFFQNREIIENQEWFKNIKENLSQNDFLQNFGYGGYKIFYTYTTHHYLGLRFTVSEISEFLNLPLEDAFRAYGISFPYVMLLKYVVLFLVFFRGNATPVAILFISELAMNRFEPANFGGGVMGLIFTSSAITIRLFWDSSRKKLVSYGLAMVGAVVGFQTIVVLASFMFVDLIMLINKNNFRIVDQYIKVIHKHFLYIIISLFIILNILSFIIFFYAVLENRELYAHWQQFLNMSFRYFWHPQSLLMILGFGVLVHVLAHERRETDVELLVVAAVLSCFGVIAFAILIDLNYITGVGRPIGYAQEFSALGAGLLLYKTTVGGAIPWKKWVVVGAVMFFIGVQLPVFYKKIQPNLNSDGAIWLPDQVTGRGSNIFYIARGPEAFYRYLWMGLYNRGPLVIDIPNKAYQARAKQLGMDIEPWIKNGRSR